MLLKRGPIRAEPQPKRVLVHFELERTHVVKHFSIFDTVVIHRSCLSLAKQEVKVI